MLQDFKVLTFDVVGTLIDFERGMLDYLRAVAPADAVGDDDFLAAYRKARKSGRDARGTPTTWNGSGMPSRRPSACPTAPRLARGFRDSVRDWPAFPIRLEALHGCAGASGSSR